MYAALEAKNANSPEERKVDKSLCDGLLSRIEAGEFTECVDKDCNWIGDKLVSDAVKVLWADEQDKMNAAEKAKEERRFDWSIPGSKSNSACGTWGDFFNEKAPTKD
jgi:ATP-dependent protease HslVU (ClpYQ) ATPase subunit